MTLIKTGLRLLVLVLLSFSHSSLYSQIPEIGIIDYYGSGYTKLQAENCLKLHENDSILFIQDDIEYTKTKTRIENCLLSIPGIRQAEITFVCCNQPFDNWMVYVGADSAKSSYSSANKLKDVRLPGDITASYNKLMDLLYEAIEENEAGEDNVDGHAIMRYAPAGKIQQSFITYADANLKLLREVLLTSKHPEEREVAAYVIAYHTGKKEIIGDLLAAISDPDAAVRNNSLGAIRFIADLSLKNPELDIQIDASPFIKLLNSISWTDRNKSSLVLLTLTQNRNKDIIREIKSQALKSVVDMAGWKNFGHSLPGYILLGRIIGWQEQVIMSGVNNERTAQLEEMVNAIK